ncbi:hypothetical protein VST63_19745 [Mycolicibacterium sp. 050232]|uniref:hypothetical protein n=1 Tax=Mycolicibacterium sp. 050232 TaxID=3113982 RepID=UPI002E2BDCB0|nr:hypothetical protein [Mycolicibacterium sp. 050232]MED5814597.1 hypothetical protein [Mycolicibacterium sp. 050232]
MKDVVATIAINDRPMFISMRPDGARVYTCNNDSGTVSVIDTATKKMIGAIHVATTTAGMAIHPSGTKLYVVTPKNNGPAAAETVGAVRVIDTVTNKLTANIPIGDFPVGVAIHPNGTRLYVGCLENNSVKVVDLATASVTATIDVDSAGYWLAVSPNGSRLYVGGFDINQVIVVDTATNLVTAEIPVPEVPWAIGVSPDSAHVYIGVGQLNSHAGKLCVCDAASNGISATIPMAGPPLGAVFSQDGHHLYVSNGGALSVIATATNGVLQTVQVADSVTGVAVSPDRQSIYVADGSNNVVAVIEERRPLDLEEAIARVLWRLKIVLPRIFGKPPRPINFPGGPS